MTIQQVSLSDKYDLSKQTVLLNGTQALVRLLLAQQARDAHAGLSTAGFCTGYRGSPLGAVDFQMRRAARELAKANIVFQEGLNEDLAATAIWGTQQAELRGDGKYDGVFGLWYGKGPGVDRSGDVMRHSNMAGTSVHGGVIMAMGDDHTGESSTVLHQSDWAMVDASMPVISPAGVQEILDYGHYGYALSRYSGLWVGLKTMKDTIEVTSVVDADPHRMSFKTPKDDLPQGGLNIRLVDTPTDQEYRLLNYKIAAAERFARENRIDRRVLGQRGAKIGIAAAGKNWLDVAHAMASLGIDQQAACALGITTYKIVQTWPLDKQSFAEWADGLDVVIIVEEKRKLIEPQAKDTLFHDRNGRRVYGEKWGDQTLFASHGALDPVDIAEKLGLIFLAEGCANKSVSDAIVRLQQVKSSENAPDIAARLPYFCAGCPHNSSTKVPEGSRAYAGIGCHFMAQWMDRSTLGFTHMGAEGANWIGESHFTHQGHVFQNIGDGTYNHSGIQAIRAAVAAGTTMTYKILFNDAVAMTGGQGNDGGLSAPRIARELQAMGIEHIALVYDDKEYIDFNAFPSGLDVKDRTHLMDVQTKMAQTTGVSAILYVQTCAAEKRRRRKRGQFPDPDQRIFINTDICEGCGDCGVQSNCVAITPVDTELGRKRQIDQSACNKDFSCVNGFCPSFVTLHGAVVKKPEKTTLSIPNLPQPDVPQIADNATFNVVITGVGGTGVVTLGAILAQAAQIQGKGAGMMEMAGLAQKGGAVHIHCRLANSPNDISAIRVAAGECDALIGGDLVVSAGSKTLYLTNSPRTKAVVNNHDVITGDFTRDRNFQIPNDQLELKLQARLGENVAFFDTSQLASQILGDAIYGNMVLMGAAWQSGLIPLSQDAIFAAIELNGAGVDGNKLAFDLGRWCVVDRAAVMGLIPQSGTVAELPKTLDQKIEFRAEHLADYQNEKLSQRYRAFVNRFENNDLKQAVAVNYHKLLSYKDEYEVARLHLHTMTKAQDQFSDIKSIEFHLAPPILSTIGTDGRPKKRKFGPAMLRVFGLLARFKSLRGTPLDVFGYTKERRMERELIRDYERDMIWALDHLSDTTLPDIIALASLPNDIRGFGPVKEAAVRKSRELRQTLLQRISQPDDPHRHAAE